MTAVEPYEALRLPELPVTDQLRDAYSDLLTAVCGMPYPGGNADAIAYALRWMRANPERADVLLGRTEGATQ
ncbi:hypothetical protein Ade02nite_19060 [Paractinoplanes deccanensis]|uniref:Uncharacterized protein n=1 Tax=Paractinoplanes deccanensis TaxID=113561 RepID=A0ABQ3XZY2_9ACTN|nr:hypothetical protein [Actinoplanes deccanensis]GID73265.1 hypothetical protein Ade02nite_19060 [Actinoplanes deccanensis]